MDIWKGVILNVGDDIKITKFNYLIYEIAKKKLVSVGDITFANSN